MALKRVRIGSLVDIGQYDDGDYDSAIETDQPIKAGKPVAANDVVRLSDLNDMVFAVGRLYLTVDAGDDPAVTLGFGTWSLIAQGQMLVGYKSGDPDFGTIEGTGGNKTVTHSHNHDGTAVDAHDISVTGPENQAPIGVGAGAAIAVPPPNHDHPTPVLYHAVTQPTAHGDHNILNPYFTIFVWKRTA